jgi:hypothetical protein
MNYEPFNTLARECIKYVNPEYDWRFIHADSYTFYSHTGSILYKSSFPLFREMQNELFKAIREEVGLADAFITNLTLVNCSEHSVCHPMPLMSGVITLNAAGAYASIRKNGEDKSRLTAYRAMHLHAPHLMKWEASESIGFYVGNQKHLFPGSRIFNYYPKAGTQFFYFHIDQSYTLLGKKKDE